MRRFLLVVASLALFIVPAFAEQASSVASDVMRLWRMKIVTHIAQFRRAETVKRPATVFLKFTIDHAGRLKSVDIAESSGIASVDRGAVRMIERADPFPLPPPEMGTDDVSFRVPVRFMP